MYANSDCSAFRLEIWGNDIVPTATNVGTFDPFAIIDSTSGNFDINTRSIDGFSDPFATTNQAESVFDFEGQFRTDQSNRRDEIGPRNGHITDTSFNYEFQ